MAHPQLPSLGHRNLPIAAAVTPLIALLLLAIPSLSRAQGRPSSTPLGGRCALMGGTGVALGRDGASPFLNPATMSRIGDTRLAFSVRFYRYSKSTTEALVRIPTGPNQTQFQNLEQGSLSAVPSSFCAFITLSGLIPEEARGLLRVVRGSSGRTKLGLCGASIERESFGLTAAHRQLEADDGSAAANLDLERSWQRQSLGPSISYQLTDSLTLGLSMHVVSTSVRDSSSLAVVSSSPEFGGQPLTYLHQAAGSSLDGMTTLGLTHGWRFLTSGLSLRLPSIHFADAVKSTRFVQPGAGRASLHAGSGELSAPLPPILTFGVGVEWASSSLEFDVATTFAGPSAFETSVDETSFTGTDLSPASRRVGAVASGRSVVSFRVGGEWALSPSLGILAGTRYEPSPVMASTKNAAYRMGPTDQSELAASLGLGSYGDGTELLVGTQVSYGWATLSIPNPGFDGTGYALAEQRTWSALLVLSGSIGLSSVRRTWRNVRTLAIPSE